MRRITDQQARKAHLLEGEGIDELHALAKKEVIEKHDALVDEAARTGVFDIAERMRFLQRAQGYADELTRREAEAQGTRMEALTRSRYVFSAVGVLVAFVGVVLAAMTYLAG